MSGYCPDCGNTLCICDSETRVTYPYRVKILELEAEIDELKIQDQIIAKEIKTYKIIADNLRTVVKINQAENAKLRDALIKIDNSNDDMKYFNYDIHKIISETREALKELEDK